MHEILGKKRIQLLVFMLIINATLAGGYYYYIQPMKQEAVQEFHSMRAEAQKRRSEVRELKLSFARLLPKIADYKKLQSRGFFSNQKRTIAQEAINNYRDHASLLAAKYEISPADIIEDSRAQEANFAVLSSPVNIEMEALDDVDIYTFLALMKRDFPGNLDVRTLSIERQRDIESDLLQNIASGEPEVLMQAEMEVYWRTMASESELDEF